MKVFKNFLYNASYQVLIMILPLITTPYVTRVLGSEGIGIYSFTTAVTTYFIIFGSVGVQTYGNREIAYWRDNKEKMTTSFWEIFLLRLLTVTISFVFFLLFLGTDARFKIYYLIQGINIIAVIFDISWFFMGLEQFKITVIRNFIIKIISVVLIFLFVKTRNDLSVYIAVLSGSTILGNLSLWVNLSKYIIRVPASSLNIFKHFKPSLLLFLPQIATQIYMVLNKSMIGVIDSVTASGFFTQSDNMVRLAASIVGAIGTVMLPRMANLFAKKDIDGAKKAISVSFNFATAISVGMMFGLMSISRYFAPFFFGDEFTQVGCLIMIESTILPLLAWTNVIGIQYLLPVNRLKEFTVSVALGAVVNIILNVPLIYWWGVKGATVATVLSELIVFVSQLIYFSSEFDIKEMMRGTISYFTAGFVMFVAVTMLLQYVRFTIISLLLLVFVGLTVYIVMLVILKTEAYLVVRDKFTSRIK